MEEDVAVVLLSTRMSPGQDYAEAGFVHGKILDHGNIARDAKIITSGNVAFGTGGLIRDRGPRIAQTTRRVIYGGSSARSVSQ